MKAMLLRQLGSLAENGTPLALESYPDPSPRRREILVRVRVCGVCHTELDEIEGRTPPPLLPVILGHQVVGTVEAKGKEASRFGIGDRVGVAWIYSACGRCEFCQREEENLCEHFVATGRDAHGGYAELMTVREDFAYPIPDSLADAEAAPLLCAGAIGYRSLRLTGLQDGMRLGLTGFGASGHLVLKMARYRFPASDVFVFARSPEERDFARTLGAVWAGGTEEQAPERLDAIIDTTPVWKPVVEALKNLAPGGRLVINAIRKENADQDYLLRIHYPEHLWLEKELKSVANVTRRDVNELLRLAGEMKLVPDYQELALEDANQALGELKASKIRGAKVLRLSQSPADTRQPGARTSSLKQS